MTIALAPDAPVFGRAFLEREHHARRPLHRVQGAEPGPALKSEIVTVRDTIPPVLTGVPSDITVECDSVPAPANSTASDNCDPAPAVSFAESRADGPCRDTYTLTRTWTARDRCGNARSQAQVVAVRDTTNPTLAGVPPNVTVECDSVPAPAPVAAGDNCDPAPALSFGEVRTDGDCPDRYTLTRTWTAVDRCGNLTRQSQTLTVVDTAPPVVQPGEDDLYCLRPPNHKLVCFDRSRFSPVLSDNCSDGLVWRFVDCPSDQPDPGKPRGKEGNDCRVSPDGESLCVRAEQAGSDPEGRRYSVTIVAEDACSNVSGPVVIGYIYVPHDQSPNQECIKTSEVRGGVK